MAFFRNLLRTFPVRRNPAVQSSFRYYSTLLPASSNACLNFFKLKDDSPRETVVERAYFSWVKDPLTTVSIIAHLRHKPSLQNFYSAAHWLRLCHPQTLASNLKYYVYLGNHSDAIEILEAAAGEEFKSGGADEKSFLILQEAVSTLFLERLQKDVHNFRHGKYMHISDACLCFEKVNSLPERKLILENVAKHIQCLCSEDGSSPYESQNGTPAEILEDVVKHLQSICAADDGSRASAPYESQNDTPAQKLFKNVIVPLVDLRKQMAKLIKDIMDGRMRLDRQVFEEGTNDAAALEEKEIEMLDWTQDQRDEFIRQSATVNLKDILETEVTDYKDALSQSMDIDVTYDEDSLAAEVKKMEKFLERHEPYLQVID